MTWFAAISLIISTIISSLGVWANGWFPFAGTTLEAERGRVLGVFESVIPWPDQELGHLPAAPAKPAGPKISFDLPADNGVVYDCADQNLAFAKSPDRDWPIASITKLFSAYTFLDFNPGWDKSYVLSEQDRRDGGKIYLFTGDKVTAKDLFYFSLVGSDNTATAALVHATGLSEAEFVKKMNEKVKALGLTSTKFQDAVGLSDGNISTAREVAQFAKLALANPDISRATLTKKYEFTTAQGKKKTIASTDELLAVFPENGVKIMGGKTGFINSAGYCLVSRFKNHDNKEIITVVLGADSDQARFSLTKRLVELYYGGEQ